MSAGRKWRDAAWVLPCAGLALFMFPVFWPTPSEGGTSNLGPIYYFFGLWLALIICARVVARRAQADHASEQESSPPDRARNSEQEASDV